MANVITQIVTATDISAGANLATALVLAAATNQVSATIVVTSPATGPASNPNGSLLRAFLVTAPGTALTGAQAVVQCQRCAKTVEFQMPKTYAGEIMTLQIPAVDARGGNLYFWIEGGTYATGTKADVYTFETTI